MYQGRIFVEIIFRFLSYVDYYFDLAEEKKKSDLKKTYSLFYETFLFYDVSTYLPTYLTIPTQYPSTDDGGAASVMCRDAHMSLHFESTQLVV